MLLYISQYLIVNVWILPLPRKVLSAHARFWRMPASRIQGLEQGTMRAELFQVDQKRRITSG
jgi:hypothetical protein